MKKHIKVFKSPHGARYKYYIQLGSPGYEIKVYVVSSLITFTESNAYLVLPKAKAELVVKDDFLLLKKSDNCFTFNAFLQAGTAGKSKFTKILPTPIAQVSYKIRDQKYVKSLSEGVLFTIDKPVAILSYVRDGKEFPPNYSKGTFTMLLDGTTKPLKDV